MSIQERLRSILSEEEQAKRQYRSPVLMVFGKVALLTQSQSGTCQGDATNCQPNMAGTTGAMQGSSASIKENIVCIGVHPLGIGLYLFDYRAEYRETWGHGRQFGVMADEVEAVMPQAVSVHPEGYRMVDYGMLGIQRPFQ